MSDFENKVGLSSRLTPDNKGFWPMVLWTCKCFWWLAILWVVSTRVVHLVQDWFTHQEVLPYVPCYLDVGFPVSPLLIKDLNSTGDIACSTTLRTTSEACLCCFSGECYRRINIAFMGNSSKKVVLIDEIDGVFYERTIPESIRFCYMNLRGNEECKTETDTERVGYILRVIEVANGWPIGGEVVDDPAQVVHNGWFF